MRLIDGDALFEKVADLFPYCGHCDGYGFVQKECVEDIVKEAPTTEQPTWISCAERLPELHTKVLCCGKKGGRFIAELHTWGRDNALYWTKRDGKGCPTVTHWMPLPQPPKGDE